MLYLIIVRLYLAALHYNENADRPQSVNRAVEQVYSVRFPKYKKGGFTVTPVKDNPTYGISINLVTVLFHS
jgi:hypothetical protein